MFTREVELPEEPKYKDQIDIGHDLFRWHGKIITPIKNTNPVNGILFEATDDSTSFVEEKGNLKDSLIYLVSSYEKAGWKAEIPEIWQEIIDEPDD